MSFLSEVNNHLLIFFYPNFCYRISHAKLIKASTPVKRSRLDVVSYALFSSVLATNSLARSLVTYTLSFNGYHSNEKRHYKMHKLLTCCRSQKKELRINFCKIAPHLRKTAVKPTSCPSQIAH